MIGSQVQIKITLNINKFSLKSIYIQKFNFKIIYLIHWNLSKNLLQVNMNNEGLAVSFIWKD